MDKLALPSGSLQLSPAFYATVMILRLQATRGGIPAAVAASGGARQQGQGGLDSTGHSGVLYMATVGFGPAGKLALVDGVFSPCAGNIIHPDETRTCTQKTIQWGLQWLDLYTQT